MTQDAPDMRFQDAVRAKMDLLRISPADLSRRCGFANERRIAAMIKQPNTPNLVDAALVARELRLSLDAVFGIASDQITVNEVLSVYSDFGECYEAYADLLDHCDEYWVPKSRDRVLRPTRLGKHTEVSRRLNGNLTAYSVSLRAFCMTKKGQHILSEHKLAAERGFLVAKGELNGTAPGLNMQVVARYIRVTIRTRKESGEEQMLNFPIMLGS